MMRVGCFALLCFALLLSSSNAQDLPLKDILIPGENWQLVGEGYKFTEAPAADLDGNLYFSDVPASKIYKIDAATGKLSDFLNDGGKTSGLALGPGGVLFASQSGKQTIAKIETTGKLTIFAEEAPGNDLIVARDGGVYCTDSGKGNILYISPAGEKRVVAEGIKFPNGIILTPDGGTLAVAEMQTDKLLYFRVEKDGSLSFKQPYTTLMMIRGKSDSGSDGMAVDTVGRIYVATHAGVQVIDTQGRVSGVMANRKPRSSRTSTSVAPRWIRSMQPAPIRSSNGRSTRKGLCWASKKRRFIVSQSYAVLQFPDRSSSRSRRS